MKTLAETIREALDAINEASNLEYALTDLHNESGGNPTPELAADIAADYVGVTPEKLLQAYPQWAATQANKTNTPPPMSAAKAKNMQKHNEIQRNKKWEKEREERTAAELADKEAFRGKNAQLIQDIEAEMETIQAPAGWTKTIQPGRWQGKSDIADMIFLNDAGNIQIVMHVTFDDPTRELIGKEVRPDVFYAVHGDTTYQRGGRWYTFTDYSKWGDSFSIGQYSDGDTTFAAIPSVIEREAKRAQLRINSQA